MYATLSELRAEGVTRDEALDARAVAALQEATEMIDRACGWFFEPRELALTLNGGGGPVLELPVPPIRLSRIRVGCEYHAPSNFVMVGAPITAPRFTVPKLVAREGVFPRGVHNVWLQGIWGYTVPCAEQSEGDTPRPIRRATLALARRLLPKLTDDDAVFERNHWRLVEERTRDQSYRMEPMKPGELTGDPEVDALLAPYRRPMALGCA